MAALTSPQTERLCLAARPIFLFPANQIPSLQMAIVYPAPPSLCCASLPESLPGLTLSRLPTAALLRLQSRKGRGMRFPSSNIPFRRSMEKSLVGKVSCRSPDHSLGAVTVATWKESVLKCDILVLVEFWASWCGPCRMVDPIFEEIAEEYAGKIKCFKLNTDDNEKITAEYGIEKIPTVALFKNGEKRLAITGTMPKSVYVAAIEKVLASQEGNMAN